MLDLALRNIRKQRTRTLLTVVGIVIGITAIVALGSFAEGINVMVTDQLNEIAGKIIVMQAGSSMSSGPIGSDITQEQVDSIMSLSGIEVAAPLVFYMPTTAESHMFSSTWTAIGVEPDKIDLLLGSTIKMEDGDRLEDNTHDVAMVGSPLAEKLGLKTGDFFTIKDRDFLITGIVEKTGNSNVDDSIIVPLEDLQSVIGKEDSYQMVYVVPEDPQQTDVIADEINQMDDTLSALSSKDLARQVSGIIDTIRIFTLGVGAIAAFVGGLGVMNTMIMAVIERKRELGVMKAVGATRRFILIQILTESSALSLIGGLIGLALGWLISLGLGAFTGGMVNGIVTPELALGSLAFALALGVFGGLYPAWKAVKLDPVEALRG